jgi:hypothetical protein
MKKLTAKWSSSVVLGLALCGCIHSNQTVYNNPDRLKVEFENDTAARLFYETLSKSHPVSSRHESDTTVEIPVVFANHRHVVDGENVAFNEAVRQCDTNQDGKITEQEARIYSERSGK